MCFYKCLLSFSFYRARSSFSSIRSIPNDNNEYLLSRGNYEKIYSLGIEKHIDFTSNVGFNWNFLLIVTSCRSILKSIEWNDWFVNALYSFTNTACRYDSGHLLDVWWMNPVNISTYKSISFSRCLMFTNRKMFTLLRSMKCIGIKTRSIDTDAEKYVCAAARSASKLFWIKMTAISDSFLTG